MVKQDEDPNADSHGRQDRGNKSEHIYKKAEVWKQNPKSNKNKRSRQGQIQELKKYKKCDN